MKPDIIIRGGAQTIIIDTKYKLLKPEDRKYGVSQADMYQMYAYATRTTATKAGERPCHSQNRLGWGRQQDEREDMVCSVAD